MDLDLEGPLELFFLRRFATCAFVSAVLSFLRDEFPSEPCRLLEWPEELFPSEPCRLLEEPDELRDFTVCGFDDLDWLNAFMSIRRLPFDGVFAVFGSGTASSADVLCGSLFENEDLRKTPLTGLALYNEVPVDAFLVFDRWEDAFFSFALPRIPPSAPSELPFFPLLPRRLFDDVERR